MYLGDVFRSLRRRWYLVLAALVITILACLVLSTRVQPTYTSTANVVLIPPTDSQEPDSNRLLSLSDVVTSVDVISRSMGSAETSRALTEQAPQATYTVTGDPTTSAPVLVVTTSSSDRAQAQTMLEAVLTQLPKQVSSIQAAVQIAPSRRITVVVISRDDKPTAVNGTRVRVLAVAFVGLLGAFGVAIAALDGLLVRRRRSPGSRDGGTPHRGRRTGKQRPRERRPARPRVTDDAEPALSGGRSRPPGERER